MQICHVINTETASEEKESKMSPLGVRTSCLSFAFIQVQTLFPCQPLPLKKAHQHLLPGWDTLCQAMAPSQY